MRKLFGLAGCLVLLVAVGCNSGSGSETAAVAPVATPSGPSFTYTPKAEAGIPVTQSADAAAFGKLVEANSGKFVARRDPFALSGEEAAYDASQSSERLLQSTGGYSLDYTPPEVKIDEQPVLEEQPYRRLAGVIVGDSVLALIVLEDGRTELIRPGQQIPGTEWKVASIDEDKATLVRGGNKLPKRISVRLESPPAGMAPAGGAAGRGNAGAGGGGPRAAGAAGAGGGPGAAGRGEN